MRGAPVPLTFHTSHFTGSHRPWARNPYSSRGDALGADEFGFESGFAVLQEHGNHFTEVGLQNGIAFFAAVTLWRESAS